MPAARKKAIAPVEVDRRELVYRDPATLISAKNNARTHSAEQISQIRASINSFGPTNPILIDEADVIIAGHGRRDAAVLAPALTEFPCIVLVGLTNEQKRALVIMDNKLALNAGWDLEILGVELADLRDQGVDLQLVGFDPEELASLWAAEPDETGGGEPDANSGSLLARVDITIDEPKHQVKRGDHYVLADRHHLICVSVLRDWALYMPLLTPGAIFCPYPGPFVPYGETSETHPLVLVQSDTYIAGHLLDRYAECFGEEAVKKVAAK